MSNAETTKSTAMFYKPFVYMFFSLWKGTICMYDVMSNAETTKSTAIFYKPFVYMVCFSLS